MTTPFGPWLVGFRGQVIPLFIVGDIISDNWDGAIPPALPDPTATQGYALDASEGGAQFNGFVVIGEGGTLSVGGPAPAGASSQFFVTAPLEHIALIESEDVDDNVAVIDINDDIFRIFWYAPFPTAVRGLEIDQTGKIHLVNGPVILPNGSAGAPSYSFTDDETDGFYRASGRVSGAIGGVEVWRMSENPTQNLPAYRRTGSNQTIPNNTTTAVTFGTLAWDYGSDPITFSSPTYTVPIDGLLDIFYYAQWATNTTGRRRDRILLNGSVVAQSQYTGNTTEPSITTCCCIEVSAGDTIDIDALQNSGGDLVLESKRLTLAYRANGIVF